MRCHWTNSSSFQNKFSTLKQILVCSYHQLEAKALRLQSGKGKPAEGQEQNQKIPEPKVWEFLIWARAVWALPATVAPRSVLGRAMAFSAFRLHRSQLLLAATNPSDAFKSIYSSWQYRISKITSSFHFIISGMEQYFLLFDLNFPHSRISEYGGEKKKKNYVYLSRAAQGLNVSGGPLPSLAGTFKTDDSSEGTHLSRPLLPRLRITSGPCPGPFAASVSRGNQSQTHYSQSQVPKGN